MPGRVLLLLLSVAILRGAAYLPVSWSLEELSLAQVVALEVTVAAVAMTAILAALGRLGDFVAELRSRPLLALRLTLLQTVVPFVLIGVGLQHVPTGTASVLVCAAPLFATTVAGALDAKDRPTRVQGLGLLVGLAGVGLVVGVEALGTTEQALGALALLATALIYVFAGLTFRTHYRETPVVVSAGIGIVPALPFVLPVLALTAPAQVPGARVVGSLLLLGTFGIAVALVAFYALQRRVGPVRALLVSYLNPIVAVLLGVALLGEALSVTTVVGMALIVGGVVLATRPDPRLAAAPVPLPAPATRELAAA